MNIAIEARRQEIGERIARAVLDIDHFSTALSQDLARSKASVIREHVQALTTQAQALRLAINMDLTGERLLAPCEDLKQTATSLRLLCSKSRMSEGTKLALELVVKLLPQLHQDLQDWDGATTGAHNVISPR